MTAIFAVLALLLCAAAALALFARHDARRSPAAVAAREAIAPWQSSTAWTKDAGDEFDGLSESARCDLIFAVADLRDDRSRDLLVHALDDPSEAVALAAAHALAQRGERDAIAARTAIYPNERAQRILDTLALME